MTALGGARVGLAMVPENLMAAPYDRDEDLRRIIREAMIAGGLGTVDESCPLSDIVKPGMSVLLKPNWVLHENRSGRTMDCMVTHPAFLLATVREVVGAGAGRILIADAPIQGADFGRLTPPSWREAVREAAGAVPVDILDFRNTVANVVRGRLSADVDRRPPERFILFTLGRESCLEPISNMAGSFRITSYSPLAMAEVQRSGMHQFLLCREPFEADVILNLPKLKAHSKAGITAALKNLVGINGDKNYLPHHRVGGSAVGGDCYEGLKPFKRAAEFCVDMANRRIGRSSYLPWMKAAGALRRVHGGDLEGQWHGNDTTWRMVLDLNRILIYGREDGTLATEPQRRVFSLTDAIVAGQRNGPLAPEEIGLGAVSFAENSVFADLTHSALMRFDWRRLALIREAFTPMGHPLVDLPPEDVDVCCGGARLSLADVVKSCSKAFRPPDGWKGQIELV